MCLYTKVNSAWTIFLQHAPAASHDLDTTIAVLKKNVSVNHKHPTANAKLKLLNKHDK